MLGVILRSKLKLEAKHLKKQRLKRQGLINNCKKLKAGKLQAEEEGLEELLKLQEQLQALGFLEALKVQQVRCLGLLAAQAALLLAAPLVPKLVNLDKL